MFVSMLLLTRSFHVRPYSMGMTRFLYVLENHLKKNGLESPLILFYFKEENKIRNKNPKLDS